MIYKFIFYLTLKRKTVFIYIVLEVIENKHIEPYRYIF